MFFRWVGEGLRVDCWWVLGLEGLGGVGGGLKDVVERIVGVGLRMGLGVGLKFEGRVKSSEKVWKGIRDGIEGWV